MIATAVNIAGNNATTPLLPGIPKQPESIAPVCEERKDSIFRKMLAAKRK